MDLANSKILVTGGAGFIGSHIVYDLVKSGAKVRVFDNFSSGHKVNLNEVKDDVEVIEGDILDIEVLLKAAEGVDAICHQAAQLEIIHCIETPDSDLRTNCEGTINILETARRLNISKVVYASSACVYGQAQYVPEDEIHPTIPNWPYGISKLAVEHYARLYHDYYGIDTIGLRYSIVYGPREWYGRVLTIFLRRALEGKPPVVWGGNQKRDFVFVNDISKLNIMCLELDGLGNKIYNGSTSIGTSIKELAELISSKFNISNPIYETIKEGEFSRHVEGRMRLPAELDSMILSSEKAKSELGWIPSCILDKGVEEEMNWLTENLTQWHTLHY